MRRNLTDKFVRSLRAAPPGKRVEHWDATVPGFGVRVTDRGHKTFVLYTRWPPTRTPARREIGNADRLSLAAARKRAREWLELVELGIDPQEQQRAAEAEARHKRLITFEAVAKDWFADETFKRQRKAGEVQRDVMREFVSRWGSRPIASITTLDVVEVIRAKKAQGHPAQARNLLDHMRRFFKWVLGQHVYRIENSPVASIDGKELIGPKNSRQRTLSDDEIRAVWSAAEQMPYPYGPVTRLLLMTGQRKSEIGDGRWREIDFTKREWRIPAERMKMGKEHILPLTPAMIELLQSLPRFTAGDYIFSTDFGVKPCNGYSKAKERLDALTGPFEKPYVIHDLRRTMRSHIEDERLGIRERVAEAMIAHKPPRTYGTYVVYKYLNEKRRGFEKWDERLRAILLRQDYDTLNVVALHG